MKVCLVGSSGGHLNHLYMLKPFWKDKDHFWVTFDKEDARSLLEGEKMYPCYYPTNRSLKALIKNTKIAWNVLHKEKPDLIISCGAAVAVPFFYLGKMMGAKLVYIEVFDRIDKPTMTGKMVYPIVDKFVVQWEEQKKVYPKAVNLGNIFGGLDFFSLRVAFNLNMAYNKLFIAGSTIDYTTHLQHCFCSTVCSAARCRFHNIRIVFVAPCPHRLRHIPMLFYVFCGAGF